jgi:threonyl-tRNA synthetase
MADERKTPEMRAQMTDIERLRHSAAHVLATAIICHPERSEGSLNPVTNHTSNE